MLIKPNNWAELQHYKDRSPPWIKLHKKLLDNFEYQRLPLASRALAPMLWLLASEHEHGHIDATPEKLAFRLRCEESEIEEALKPLIEKEFFSPCEQPASKPLAKPRRAATPETEKSREEDSSSAAKLPPCPHQKVIALFAELLPELPQPKLELWDGKRARDLSARWKWLLTKTKQSGERYATTEDEALDFFRRFFAYVAGSDFLSGRDGKWTGCDLGWLVNFDNFAKVLQGNYENKEAA